MVPGEQSVMIAGTSMMQLWCVVSWDFKTQIQVSGTDEETLVTVPKSDWSIAMQ